MARQAICKTGEVPPMSIRQFEAAGGKLCIVNAGDYATLPATWPSAPSA